MRPSLPPPAPIEDVSEMPLDCLRELEEDLKREEVDRDDDEEEDEEEGAATDVDNDVDVDDLISLNFSFTVFHSPMPSNERVRMRSMLLLVMSPRRFLVVASLVLLCVKRFVMSSAQFHTKNVMSISKNACDVGGENSMNALGRMVVPKRRESLTIGGEPLCARHRFIVCAASSHVRFIIIAFSKNRGEYLVMRESTKSNCIRTDK